MAKFCKTCSYIICDFCHHYDFNGDELGCYTGDGWCNKHNKEEDPCGGCDDFYCDIAHKTGEVYDEIQSAQ